MPDNLRRFLTKHREGILYLFFGGLTTLISTGLFFALRMVWPASLTIGPNIVSQAVSVLFAYATNRRWVFCSRTRGMKQLREIAAFLSARVFTILLDIALVFVSVDLLRLNEIICKCVTVAVVVVLNYILSRFWIFLRRESR